MGPTPGLLFVLTERGLWRQTGTQGKHQVKMKSEIRVIFLQAKTHQTANKPPETRRLAQTLPHSGQKDSALPKLDLGLLASTTKRQQTSV